MAWRATTPSASVSSPSASTEADATTVENRGRGADCCRGGEGAALRRASDNRGTPRASDAVDMSAEGNALASRARRE